MSMLNDVDTESASLMYWSTKNEETKHSCVRAEYLPTAVVSTSMTVLQPL